MESPDISVDTITNYFYYLENVFLLHNIKRYDIRGKKILEFNNKIYIADTGLINSITGYKHEDISGILENIVLIELLSRGYDVFTGHLNRKTNESKKLNGKEIDFIAIKNNNPVYIQVTYLLADKSTIKREF